MLRADAIILSCVTIPLPCRYGLFLTCLAISILFSEGWIGPVTCLVTQILPPELKAFGVSLWCAIANIIMPAGNVLFGIYLMVCSPVTPTTCLHIEACLEVQPITKLRQVYMNAMGVMHAQIAAPHLPPFAPGTNRDMPGHAQ